MTRLPCQQQGGGVLFPILNIQISEHHIFAVLFENLNFQSPTFPNEWLCPSTFALMADNGKWQPKFCKGTQMFWGSSAFEAIF